jgi:hypothetical protein
MFEKLFNFEHVGLLFQDIKKDQLYIINMTTINKKDYLVQPGNTAGVESS